LCGPPEPDLGGPFFILFKCSNRPSAAYNIKMKLMSGMRMVLKSDMRMKLKSGLSIPPKSKFRSLSALSAVALLAISSFSAHAQDDAKRGRKYQPPPPTAHVSIEVIKDTNGKPVENAAVVFHLTGEEGKGNMEMKTNEDGKAVIDVVPIGDTMRLQIIAEGFQTFGQDYKIDTDSKDITVRLKRPQKQYSTYEHAASGGTAGSQSAAPQQSTPQTPPKQ
jgi:Carboxypeptidase regulatory-like domain